MEIVKQVTGHRVQLGAEEHSGWLPQGAAMPSPTETRTLLLDVYILFDGRGYVMEWRDRDSGESNDTWHQTLGDAEDCAQESFGIGHNDWQPPDSAARP